MDFKNTCVTLIIILQTLPQLLHSAGLNYPCEIPELSNNYNYDANGIQLFTGLYAPDGTRVSFKCKNNLMLYPPNNIRTTCIDGSWTNEFPQCIRTCTPRISKFVDVECDLRYVKINCTSRIPVPDGTVARMKCKENFTLSSFASDIARCKDGIWDNDLLPCVSVFEGSKINQTSDCENDRAEVTCSNESDKPVVLDVMPKSGECELPTLENGKFISLSTGLTLEPGKTVPEYSVVQTKCDKDFHTTSSTKFSLCSEGKLKPDLPLCLVCGKLNPKSLNSIPWHINLYKEQKKNLTFLCSGVLISRNVILTAAHCVTNPDGMVDTNKTFYVSAGNKQNSITNSPDSSLQLIQVKESIASSFYRGRVDNYFGNLALVVGADPFNITENVMPVCLDLTNEYMNDFINKSGIVSGWFIKGPMNQDGSNGLKQISVPLRQHDDCVKVMGENFGPYLTVDTFCAGLTNGSAICRGDSGGGLVFHRDNDQSYYVKGIASLGASTPDGECDHTKYNVYVNISQHAGFINDVIYRNWIY